MDFLVQIHPLWAGLIIFAARVADVSAGTLRTISIVYGRTVLAFILGLVEVSLWLVVVAAVINHVMHEPILGVFYALGFSAGNVVGIKLEKRISFGHMVLRIISRKKGADLARSFREMGYGVTTFEGQGMHGPVTELYVVCRRRDMGKLISRALEIDRKAFYTAEQAGMVSKVYRPIMQPTGWRAIFKKK